MSDISRKEAIGIFKNMLDAWDNYYTIASSDKKKEAVKLAIDSLEVDEAYQLEYEVSAGQRRCNKCKYYEGVHNIMGHAPCSYHKIGGVLWDWYCSQFESNISDHHKQNIKAYAHDFGISEEQAEKELRVTTKNDLGVDCISRQFMYELGATCIATRNKNGKLIALGTIEELPSVTPQEPQSFKWCETCKEYDQEKHCCHRYSKVIRDTVEEMKQEPKTGHWILVHPLQENDGGAYMCSNCKTGDWSYQSDYNFCPNCGARMVEPQESEG